ncbi:MAG: DUF1573 domain-containing protein [Kiritimatiellia bacterium]
MRRRALLLTGWAVVLPLLAARSAPRITCAEPEFDFGRAGEGEALEKRFLIGNAGDADLVISRIVPSCTSCTVINVSTNRVPPGGSLSVPVRLTLGGFNGMIAKKVTIESNDPVNPRFELALKGEVVSDIILRPAVVVFGQLAEGVPAEQEVSVAAGEGHALTVTGVECTQGIFKPELVVEEAGKNYKVRLRFDGSFFPEDRMLVRGRMADMLVIRTESPGRPVLKVGIQGLLTPSLRVFPAEMKFPAHSPATTATIMIRGAPGKTFRVLKAEWPQAGVDAEITGPTPLGYRVVFRGVTLDDAVNGKQVVITTDLKDYEHLKVPISIAHPSTCRICNPAKPSAAPATP